MHPALLKLIALTLKSGFRRAFRGARTVKGAFLTLFTMGVLLMMIGPGVFAVVGGASVLAATTQGPILAVMLTMKLTERDRSFIVRLLLGVVIASLVSRTMEPRSIYDAQRTDEEIAARMKSREPSPK